MAAKECSRMKFFRYRRPSVNTLLGITRAKKQFKKDIGITAVMKPVRWWGNEKRKVKRDLGYYSPLGKLLRLGIPRFIGVQPARATTQRTITKASPLGVLVVIAAIVVAWGGLIGGCDLKSANQPIAQPIESPPAALDSVETTVAYRPAPIKSPATERLKETEADHDLAEPPKPPTARDWTDRTGKFHTSAVLLGVVEGAVQLQKPNKIVTVSLDKLSDDDFAYLAASGVKAEPRVLVGRVIRIHDGDTLTLLDENNHQHTIRLASIDAPEYKQAFGQQARESLSKKLFQKDVRIEWSERDKYERTISNIYLDDRWINKEMVQEGWAWHYRKYSDSAELSDAEAAAHKSGIGLWAKSDAVPPWEFRQNEKNKPKPAPIVKTAKPAPIEKPAVVINTPSSSEGSYSGGGDVHVRGYTRKDGTYVQPHTRHRPSR